MAAFLSRRLLSSRSLLLPHLTNPNPNPLFCSALFSATPLSGASDSETVSSPDDSKPSSNPNQPPFQRLLENGLDPGVYKVIYLRNPWLSFFYFFFFRVSDCLGFLGSFWKAIMVGKVGQKPVQKQLRSGRAVVLFSLGTGGIRNNRRPLDDEEPREYADRCAVQWHRVSVYPERLGDLALKHVKPGSILYLEGNLETKVFSDPITGLVRRIREIAIRRDGRLVFLGNESDAAQSEPAELKRVGYY